VEFKQDTTERSWNKGEDWNRGINSGLVVEGTALRITTPAQTTVEDWSFESEGATNGLSNKWTPWSSRATFAQSATGGLTGWGQQIIRKESGAVGIVSSSKRIVNLTANSDRAYLSFFFKPSNSNFTNPTYCYVMWDDNLNNIPITDYTITDIGNGWYRYDGSIVPTKTGYAGVLIGWSGGTDGNVWIDNIYFQENVPPTWQAEWISEPVTVANGEVGSIIDSRVHYSTTLSMSSKATVYSRFSTNGGYTWTAWSPQGNDLNISGLGNGWSIDGEIQVQFRVILERFQIQSHVAYLNSLSFSLTKDFQVEVPERTEINYLSDRIKPYMEIQMKDGNWIDFPLGVFLLSTPTRHDEVNGVYRDIEAYDGLIILDDDKFTSRYTIPTGTKYTKAVENILKSAGVTDFNIADKADTLSVIKSLRLARASLKRSMSY